ncbi:Rrf2 family transcriptional regulator [candidate division WOR-3 bacterium JGI_Cruoil_03_44_89]|uniref:Rrf2 family transcriptional regulator n=1 Tax=candidate division WOR-3 bacterium JGI_Cruoil_03_44_89 TaxID=1973748 RepID=A0A235BRD1_UNCW3|nr:MAG: Rrf2 family transcriptional regulator [candidate division WOR-3 bacterium JGI_Cruoil_03_44_89]
MKLSTRGRYGARAMLDLALHYGKGPLLLKDIASRQGISERYLENIMTVLVSAGLVQSIQGRHGGFSLAKLPGEIKLSRVIQAVEGSVALVACVDDSKLCDRVDVCVTHEIWDKLKKTMLEILDSITLEDMVKMRKKKLSIRR